MAFHVACPITCKRICFCTQGFPRKQQVDTGKREFSDQIESFEKFLSDPWLIRVCEGSTVQIPVPQLALPIVSALDDDGDGADELVFAQSKRAALQKKAAVASLASEDFVWKFESGVSVDASNDSTAEDRFLLNVNVMCQLCFSSKNERSERAKQMLPCRSCGKKYHMGCLKTWSQHRDLFHWSSWKCLSCRMCKEIRHLEARTALVCRRTGDSTKFKFCKRCDDAVHCYCMQPPHKNVSSGPYLCPKHTKCHSCGSNVPGNGLSVRWFLGFTCCDACGRLFTKGNYCPVCLKVYRDSESTPMVCCDICQRWVHCQCDGISDERYMQFQIDGNLPYTCPTCRGESYQVRDLEDAVQELWRRKDEADKDLIASLRAAAGLPTQEDIFSISPFSDDEDDETSAAKSKHGGVKFAFKSLAEFSPIKTKESAKRSSSKRIAKKKEYEKALDTKMGGNHKYHDEGQSLGFRLHDDKKASHPPVPDFFSSLAIGSLNPGDRICSSSDQGVLKHKSMDEVVRINADRKPTVLQIKSKKTEATDEGKVANKAKNMKGTKFVIHLGGRNKTITNSPRSESSSYQREQELATFSGSEAISQHRMSDFSVDRSDGTANSDDVHRVNNLHQTKREKPRERNIIKFVKGKSGGSSDTQPRSGRGNGLLGLESAQIISSKRSNETSALATGLQDNVSKDEVSLRKHPDNRDDTSVYGDKNNKQVSPALDASLQDTRPLLRLKFKTLYPGSWAPHADKESASFKGQRSKRKRPAPSVERPKREEGDDMEPQDNLINEIMDANWIMKKLGKDGIGKRLEVDQPSDNSWHKRSC